MENHLTNEYPSEKYLNKTIVIKESTFIEKDNIIDKMFTISDSV